MTKKTIDNLLTQLHDAYGDDRPSPKIQQLMLDMQVHINQWNATAPEEGLLTTAKALAAELEVDHPQAAAVIRKIIGTLNDIGV